MPTANDTFCKKKITRLIVKNGCENIAVSIADIALFDTREKCTYVIDKYSKEHRLNKSLSEIQDIVDETIFFRANRQQIVNINFIRSFRSFEKVKLMVELNLFNVKPVIVISQETAPFFKKWITEC
jgi:DNA-binding LytR/AlgR family response regulator